jgi:hypothetical protein
MAEADFLYACPRYAVVPYRRRTLADGSQLCGLDGK